MEKVGNKKKVLSKFQSKVLIKYKIKKKNLFLDKHQALACHVSEQPFSVIPTVVDSVTKDDQVKYEINCVLLLFKKK